MLEAVRRLELVSRLQHPRGWVVGSRLNADLWMVHPSVEFSGSRNVTCDITGAGRDNGARVELCPLSSLVLKLILCVNVGAETVTLWVTVKMSATSSQSNAVLSANISSALYLLTLQFPVKDFIL